MLLNYYLLTNVRNFDDAYHLKTSPVNPNVLNAEDGWLNSAANTAIIVGDSNSAAFASALAEGMDGFACGSRDRADGRYL